MSVQATVATVGERSRAKNLLPRWLFIQSLRESAGESVLLTFDDGPHPTATPEILDTLRAHGAKAVFFVVGSRIHRAPHLLSRILDEGHILGNHGFDHPLTYSMRYRAYLADLVRCQNEVHDHCGRYPRLHRPPLGTVSLASAFAPRSLGLSSVLWSLSSEDWRFSSSDDALAHVAELLPAIRPLDIFFIGVILIVSR